MEPVDPNSLPDTCEGSFTDFTHYRYQSFLLNGDCSGNADIDYDASIELDKCYTGVLGTDSYDCFDSRYNIIRFFDFESSDGSCEG